MLRPGFSVAVLLAATPAIAQIPSARTLAVAVAEREWKKRLESWEEASQRVTSFHAEFKLVKRDIQSKKEVEYSGSLDWLKPDLARFRIARKENHDEYYSYICNGKAAYVYDGRDKTVAEYKLPTGASDKPWISVLSGGVKINEVLTRITGAALTKVGRGRADVTRLPNEWDEVRFAITPRDGKDKSEFESIIVSLCGPNSPKEAYLPRNIVLRKTTGHAEQTWELSNLKFNPPSLKPTDFEYVPPPKDWKVFRAQPSPPEPKPGQPGGR